MEKKKVRPKETCHHGSTQAQFSSDLLSSAHFKMEDVMKNEFSYIHEHIMTLYFIAREFNCKNIIEVGTGAGDSTVALATAASENGGLLTTIDIEDCYDAKEVIKKAGLDDSVNFLKVSGYYNIKGNYDLLFIDGDHGEEAVLEDILRFLNNQDLKIGCFVIFHDTNNPKWGKEINAAMYKCDLINRSHTTKSRNQWFRTYEWLNCNGLTVMRYEGTTRYDK